MSVPVPNLEGSGFAADSQQLATFVREKRNDYGTWDDGLQVRHHLYPNYNWSKDAPRHSHIGDDGWRPCLPFHRSGSRFSYTPGRRTTEWTRTGYPDNEESRDVYTGVDGGNVHFGDIGIPWPDQEIDNITSMAKVECLNKLGEGKVNLGQQIAESKQIAETLADAGVGLLEPIRDIKRGRIDLVPKHLGVVRRKAAGWYLQWQYGWKPLCSDLYGTYQLLQEGLKRPHLLSASRTVHTSSSGEFSQYGIDATYKTKNRVTCKVWGTVAEERLHALSNVGLTNPLSLGWEVIPYSFVVDWFMPIGNTLQSLSATAGLSFKDGCITTMREGSVKFDLPNSGKCTRNMFRFDRDIPNEWPHVYKPYYSPKPFSSQRIANLYAMINQVL